MTTRDRLPLEITSAVRFAAHEVAVAWEARALLAEVECRLGQEEAPELVELVDVEIDRTARQLDRRLKELGDELRRKVDAPS